MSAAVPHPPPHPHPHRLLILPLLLFRLPSVAILAQAVCAVHYFEAAALLTKRHQMAAGATAWRTMHIDQCRFLSQLATLEPVEYEKIKQKLLQRMAKQATDRLGKMGAQYIEKRFDFDSHVELWALWVPDPDDDVSLSSTDSSSDPDSEMDSSDSDSDSASGSEMSQTELDALLQKWFYEGWQQDMLDEEKNGQT